MIGPRTTRPFQAELHPFGPGMPASDAGAPCPALEEPTQGFTLLDALAGLAILSLIMTAVPQGLVGARHMLERSTEGLGARMAAQKVIEQTFAGRILDPGSYGGEVSGRRWQAVLTPYPDVATARRNGDEQRHRLFHAHIRVAMSGRPLELDTLVIGAVP